jgi:branched-subunit amino acid transport protein
VSIDLVPLAFLMGLATYPWRAAPLLAPGLDRLPEPVKAYLRLVGPAILAALAAVSVAVRVDPQRHTSFAIGAEWIAVGLCVAIVAARRSLLVGLVLAAGLVALLRANGLAPHP